MNCSVLQEGLHCKLASISIFQTELIVFPYTLTQKCRKNDAGFKLKRIYL